MAAAALASVAAAAWASTALAGMGQPSPKQLGLQTAATEVAEKIHSFHNLLLWIITIITAFVLLLLIYVMVRFNEKANPTPSRNTHNTTIEVAWTVIPIFILLAIAIPSFRLLFLQYSFPKPDLVIKSTGYQWYWGYEYPDHGAIQFDSYMLNDKDRAEMQKKTGLPQPRLLAVDNEVVVPVNKVTHLLLTANDVIHAWTIPSFGSKADAVPGRTTATWFKPTKTGVFYGQCSELCGKDHAFMPIAVRVVSDDVFRQWVAVMSDKGLRKQDKLDRARGIITKAALEERTGSQVAAHPAAAAPIK